MSDNQLVLPQDAPQFFTKPPDMPMNKYLKALQEYMIKAQDYADRLLLTEGPTNLFFFNKFALDVEKGKKPLGQFHRQVCNFITDNIHRQKLLLIPRSHLKSTLITIGYSTQRIVRDQNVRILILNAVWQMAVDFLSEIKKHLTENEKLIRVFGALAENPMEWSQDRITIKRSGMNIKEPTVQAAGIETSLVGGHYDLIIIDDPHNRENTSTREQIEKVILKYKDVIDLLEPNGQLIIIGTRWVEGDLYGWIMDKENPVNKSFDVLIDRSYKGNLQTGENLEILWPEKFTREELLARLDSKGFYEFSSQYQNNPVPPEDADFRREWFQYYDIEEYRHATMNDIMTIDPAISVKKDADYTAMTVGGIDLFGNIFIKDLYRKKIKPGQLINDIFLLYDTWHPKLIVIETIAFQQALAYMLNEEMRRRNKFLPIYEIKNQDKNKEMRIKGLQPVYMNKKIFHRKDLSNNVYLEDELLTFPRGLHDDVIDSVSMLLDFLVTPKQKSQRYHARYLY